MTTNVRRESAKIYQFPVRVRAVAGDHRDGSKPVPELTPRAAHVMFGSSWYHDAAIQDAEQDSGRRVTPFAS